MGWSVHLPGCAPCVTSVVHPGLWLSPTSSHFSRQTALFSVQKVSVTAPGLRPGAGGPCASGEKETGVWKDQVGCWRDQRVQIRETVGFGCQLRPTSVRVCGFAYERVVHSSSCRVAASEAHMSTCQQLGRLGTQGSYWDRWVSEPSCWRNSPCRITFPSKGHSACTDRQRTGWGHWCISCLLECHILCLCWSVWLAWYVCTYDVHLCFICVLQARVPSGDTTAPSLMPGSGAMEVWQPYLCQATGFSNPLTSHAASPTCKRQ